MTRRHNFGFTRPPVEAPASPALPLMIIAAIIIMIFALAVKHA